MHVVPTWKGAYRRCAASGLFANIKLRNPASHLLTYSACLLAYLFSLSIVHVHGSGHHVMPPLQCSIDPDDLLVTTQLVCNPPGYLERGDIGSRSNMDADGVCINAYNYIKILLGHISRYWCV